jgi:hypothetical protein
MPRPSFLILQTSQWEAPSYPPGYVSHLGAARTVALYLGLGSNGAIMERVP